MWVLIYLLICLLPLSLIVLVIASIAGAGLRTYRAGARAANEFKPYIDGFAADVQRAQERGSSFAERGQRLTETFDEIAGRWAFVVEALSDTTQSPVIRLANLAGRFTSRG